MSSRLVPLQWQSPGQMHTFQKIWVFQSPTAALLLSSHQTLAAPCGTSKCQTHGKLSSSYLCFLSTYVLWQVYALFCMCEIAQRLTVSEGHSGVMICARMHATMPESASPAARCKCCWTSPSQIMNLYLHDPSLGDPMRQLGHV